MLPMVGRISVNSVFEERQDTNADQVGRRLMPGEDQQPDHRAELVFIQMIARGFHPRQLAEQVIPRVAAFLGHQVGDVRGPVEQAVIVVPGNWTRKEEAVR